jgi:molybdopterin-guanine dinucleotide biosynthesis protein A
MNDLYGIAVCGGNSSRMGADKSMLQYHNKPQRYHVYDMLLPFCEKVFISCNETQSAGIEAGYNIIPDDPAFSNMGPMAALLTAFNKFPEKNILFIGCDYPFLTADELQKFLDNCGNGLSAFYNQEIDMYEPLLAFYPASSASALNKMYEAKQFSLQHFLKEQQAVKYFPTNKNAMQSVDTHEEFIKAKNSIN